MATEDVVVLVDGEPHPYVLSVDIALSAEQGCRSATLRTAEPDGRFWMPPGIPVVIQASGTPVLTGFVRDYDPDCSKPQTIYTVCVESKTCDAKECGTHHKTGRVEKKKLHEAANELGQGFAAKWTAEGDGFQAVPEMVYRPGETVFDTVERYARSQGCYITDNEKGDHVVFQGTRGRHAGVLMLPGNVLHGSAKLSDRSRKSETRVRGQGSRGHGKSVFRSYGKIKDGTVQRHRPHVVIHEGDADPQRLKERAGYEQKRAAGFSITASVTVPRWRDDAGKVWSPAFLIALDSPDRLRVAQDMALCSARLSWAKDAGTLATLELRDPRSFAKQGGKGGAGGKGKTDKAWSYPDDEASIETED